MMRICCVLYQMLEMVQSNANIENEEKVAESFADCIGGLVRYGCILSSLIVSVVAQNIALNFEAKNGTTIKKVLTKYKVTEVKPGVHFTVNLGDIQSEVFLYFILLIIRNNEIF